MNQEQKNQIDKFKDMLYQHVGEIQSLDQLFQKIIENGINLVLIDCNGDSIYLREPDATDCMI